MKKVIYPGTFDPVTYGHIDIVKRAVDLFDEIVVTVAVNPTKQPLFTTDERVQMLNESLKEFKTVTIDSFEGLLVEHAKQVGAIGIIRGLRQISDFEFEFQMALMNRSIKPEIETIFLVPSICYSFVSSRLVKEVYQLGGGVEKMVPEVVDQKLREKYGKDKFNV